jgi:hypothetical protein
MPLHNSNQASGPETNDINQSGSAAEKAMLPMVIAVSLRLLIENNEIVGWQANYHDGNGWGTLSDQSGFVPTFRVRKINICDESNSIRNIEVNLAGNGEQWAKEVKNMFQEQIIETLLTNCLHDLHITKIYLADKLQRVSGTNATYIVLHG